MPSLPSMYTFGLLISVSRFTLSVRAGLLPPGHECLDIGDLLLYRLFRRAAAVPHGTLVPRGPRFLICSGGVNPPGIEVLLRKTLGTVSGGLQPFSRSATNALILAICSSTAFFAGPP